MTGFSGIFAPAPTPFDSNGSIAPERIEPYVAYQVENGLSGFFAVGTWGAFPLMTLEERKCVAAAYCSAAKKYRARIIVHVGSTVIDQAVELARHAIDSGADAVASTVPFYYSGAGFYGLEHYRAYFGALLKAVSAPVMLYNNPRTTGVLLEPAQYVALCRDGVTGIKDGSQSAGWLTETIDLLNEAGLRSEIMPGNTSAMLYGFLYGLSGCISGTAVTSPGLAAEVHSAWRAGDIGRAETLHRRLQAVRRAIFEVGKAPVVAYALLKRAGIDIGVPRTPWMAANETQVDALKIRINIIESAATLNQ